MVGVSFKALTVNVNVRVTVLFRLWPSLTVTVMVAAPEEFVPGGRSPQEPTEEAVVRVTGRVIAEAAQGGRVVLVGRGAQAVLAQARPEEALHAYIVAPLEQRIGEVMSRLKLDAKSAQQMIEKTDADRDRYVEKWHGRKRQDPTNYHLVLNTGFLGYDAAAEQIVVAVTRRGWT